MPSGVDRLGALTLAAETCRLLGDRQGAASLHRLLLPHVGRNAVVGNALAYLDCVSRPLGLVAMTLGNVAEAAGHFATALATYRSLGAAARRAHVQADLAEALLARGDPARRRRALSAIISSERSRPAASARTTPHPAFGSPGSSTDRRARDPFAIAPAEGDTITNQRDLSLAPPPALCASW